MRFMRAFLALLFAALPLEVAAQSSLLMGGNTAKGHVPCFVSSGTSQPIAIDCGPAGGNTTGQGISELNVTAIGTGTAPFAAQGTGIDGTIFQIQDAASTNATGYHFLSFSANALGGGLIEYGAGGTATALPFNFKVNGTVYQFPFTTGGIIGPGTTVIGDIACWANTVGTLLSDCAAFGTSGHKVPFLDGINTWSGNQSIALGGSTWTYSNGTGGELLLSTTSANNVQAVQNNNANAYSAFAFRDRNGFEQAAIGSSALGGSGNIFPGYVFIEASGFDHNQTGPANPFAIFQTGTYGGTTSNWTRFEISGDTSSDVSLWTVTADSGVLKKRFLLAGNSGEIGIGNLVGSQRSSFAGSNYPLTLATSGGQGLRTLMAGIRKLDQLIDNAGSPIWYRFQDTDAGSVYPLSLKLDGSGSAQVGGQFSSGGAAGFNQSGANLYGYSLEVTTDNTAGGLGINTPTGQFTNIGLLHGGSAKGAVTWDNVNNKFTVGAIAAGAPLLFTANGNALVMTLTSGVQIGTPTGGDKGSGTINIGGLYYANGTAGVNCPAGVTAGTVVVTNGIVTHC